MLHFPARELYPACEVQLRDLRPHVGIVTSRPYDPRDFARVIPAPTRVASFQWITPYDFVHYQERLRYDPAMARHLATCVFYAIDLRTFGPARVTRFTGEAVVHSAPAMWLELAQVRRPHAS